MDISFTKQQFKALLRAVHIAETVKNRYAHTSEEIDTDLEKLEQYVYSLAERAGCSECVLFDASENVYRPTSTLEQGMGVVEDMEVYGTNVFWDTLAHEMMARDVSDLYTDEQWEALSEEEAEEVQEKLLNQWNAEFAEHGVDRFRAVDMTWKKKA